MPDTSHKTLSPRSLRQRISALAERPFGRLVAHFLNRLVRGSRDAASAEFEMGVGGLLGLLAAPGAFTSFLMIDKYSSFLNWYRGRLNQDIYLVSLPDKYLFLALAMAVTGIVTVLKWDRILPDAQDYLNLAPLPVRPRTVLLANATAIGIAVVVLAVDVNAVASFFFPFFVTASGMATFAAFVQFMAVHMFCVVLASLFTFFAVFALLGILSAILPREVFRACSTWVRGVVLIGFIMLLLSGYAGTAFLQRLEHMPGSVVRFLPSLWYLGLYQSLQHRAVPMLSQLANRGLVGLGAAFLLMLASYALSYRRRFAGVAEIAGRTSDQRLFAPLLWVLDLFSARATGFERALHRFAVRAMLRNEPHRLCIAVSIGLGWLLASQEAEQGPYIAAYLLILGLRLAFEMPAGVPANWIFRATLDPRHNETLPAARRVIMSFAVPLVILPAVALAWWRGDSVHALLHALVLLCVSVSLSEILLAGYRRIPFACPVPAFRDNILVVCFGLFLGFELFIHIGSGLDGWVQKYPPRFLWIPIVMTGAWWWNLRRLKDARENGELEEGLTFENIPAPTVERLNLSA
jgi:hypothetical protein